MDRIADDRGSWIASPPSVPRNDESAGVIASAAKQSRNPATGIPITLQIIRLQEGKITGASGKFARIIARHSGARDSANPESSHAHRIRVWIPGEAAGRPGRTRN
jgi:hypothetical protein